MIEDFNNMPIKIDYKRDYISIDNTHAISAENSYFKIGDKVTHEGDNENKVGTITKFSINKDTEDIIAHTEYGEGRISFLNHYNEHN